MTVPLFLANGWCGLEWTVFVPFGSGPAERKTIPNSAGLYRIRVSGQARLAYIGQTGVSLRRRLANLMLQTLADEMPFNDPHTAAPGLWAYHDAEGLQYEAAAAECSIPKNERMALECYLLWQYRQEYHQSTCCNFGRLHSRYISSRNQSSKIRGRLLPEDGPDNGMGVSIDALTMHGNPDSPDWMNLSWSSRRPLLRSEIRTIQAVGGVYAISADSERLLYIGETKNLRRRLQDHCKPVWEGANFSYVAFPAYTDTQLLEVENDLIAGYFAHTQKAPVFQFGEGRELPVD